MTRTRAAAVPVAACLAALVLAGCGGEASEPEAAPTTSPTQALTTAAPTASSPSAAPTASATPGPRVDPKVLEPAVEKAYEQELPGSTLSAVTCPSDGSAARGSKVACKVTTSGGARGEVTVRYTGTDGTRYAFTVTQTPNDLSSATIQSRIRTEFAAAEPDETITKLDCPGRFDLGKAVFTDCRMDIANGDQYIATVSRTDTGRLQIDFAAI